MEYNTPNVREISEILTDLHYIVKKNHLRLNCFKMYKTLYEADKIEHGTYKIYIQSAEYDEKMCQRYDRVLGCMNSMIEDIIAKDYSGSDR